jgi:sarcosine oxidase delta subunit
MDSRKRGRPRKNVDPKILHEAFQKGRRISTTVLASILGIDRKTLRARKKELGIVSDFDKISDEELDDLVRTYHNENPTGGHSYIMGHLRATHSLRIQRHRVTASINRIDKLGQGMRQQAVGKKISRRKYTVP